MPRPHMGMTTIMDMVTERSAIPVAMPCRKPTVPDTIMGMATRTARRKKKQPPHMPTARMCIELTLGLRLLLPRMAKK